MTDLSLALRHAPRDPAPGVWSRRLFLSQLGSVLALGTGWCRPGSSAAAPPAGSATVDPHAFGLELPPGPVRPGAQRRVLVQDEEQPVVGRVHVEVGEYTVVLLPTGQLVPFLTIETTPTDRPFQPATAEALGRRLARGPLAKSEPKITRHFVFLGNTSDEFTALTSRLLETMVPGLLSYLELVKLKASEPELTLPVLMFRTEEEYQRFRRMPPGVVAYYSVLDNYIVLCEESPLADVKPELALQQTFATIAHEGVHQILANAGVQQRLSLWPMWLSEGLAEYLAPTTPGKRLRWKGAGQINDLRMFDLEQYLKSRDGDTADGQMVEHTVVAARLTSTGYAAAWGLTHHLAKNQRVEFQRLLADVSRLGPLEGDTRIESPGITPGNLQRFRAVVGDDLAGLERKLIGHLKRQPYADPFADWPHYAAVVVSGNGGRPRRETNVFHTRGQAEKWSQEIVARLPAEQQEAAQVVIRSFPNRAAAEAFARQAR